MSAAFDHGPTISDEEYEKRIAELYRGLPPVPSAEMDREVRRRELDILIDHRLGRGFPRERREALWEAQAKVEKRRVGLALASMTRALLPGRLRRGGEELVRLVAREYARVLSREELTRFLELD